MIKYVHSHILAILFITATMYSIGCKTVKDQASGYTDKQDVYYCADTLCAKVYKGHIDTIYQHMPDDMIYDMNQALTFPVVFKIHNQSDNSSLVDPHDIHLAISNLNYAFKPVAIKFELEDIIIIDNGKTIQELTENDYALYPEFSKKHDVDKSITVHLLDDNGEYCAENNNILSCRRIHGFTYILNSKYPNIIISKPDLLNEKIMPHEMGHFFGLYHTHRDVEGKESILRQDCEITGDHLCSTPADPGPLYGVYIDYTRCEMYGLEDENGLEYKPLINNYMSYYYPCYKKSFMFTEEQYIVMRTAAEGDIRNYLIADSKAF